MEQICPKCATGICIYREGIICRARICIRDDYPPQDDKGKRLDLEGLKGGFLEWLFKGKK